MASLLEQQRSFAAALRNPELSCAVLPPANLAIYRNNASVVLQETLERTYPVVRRRVGDDYFRQLGALYRPGHPSRSGDLHWYGRDFPGFLDEQLRDGDYAWLADLARLEWLRTECSVAAEARALAADALTSIAAADLEHVVFGLQPSLRLYSSAFPVITIWLANQVENAPPVDQSVDKEHGMVRMRSSTVEIRLLPDAVFSFLTALLEGSTLGDAVTRAALDQHALTEVLGFVFQEGLVTSVKQRVGTSS